MRVTCKCCDKRVPREDAEPSEDEPDDQGRIVKTFVCHKCLYINPEEYGEPI